MKSVFGTVALVLFTVSAFAQPDWPDAVPRESNGWADYNEQKENAADRADKP